MMSIVTTVTYHNFTILTIVLNGQLDTDMSRKSALWEIENRNHLASLLSSFLRLSSDCVHLAIFVLLILDTSSVQARRVRRNQVNVI